MSKLQKWCPNYMSLHGARGYAPGVSAPRCQISVQEPDFLGGVPIDKAKVFFFYMPAYNREKDVLD